MSYELLDTHTLRYRPPPVRACSPPSHAFSPRCPRARCTRARALSCTSGGPHTRHAHTRLTPRHNAHHALRCLRASPRLHHEHSCGCTWRTATSCAHTPLCHRTPHQPTDTLACSPGCVSRSPRGPTATKRDLARPRHLTSEEPRLEPTSCVLMTFAIFARRAYRHTCA